MLSQPAEVVVPLVSFEIPPCLSTQLAGQTCCKEVCGTGRIKQNGNQGGLNDRSSSADDKLMGRREAVLGRGDNPCTEGRVRN